MLCFRHDNGKNYCIGHDKKFQSCHAQQVNYFIFTFRIPLDYIEFLTPMFLNCSVATYPE